MKYPVFAILAFTTPAFAQTLGPEDAASHAGATVTIEGTASVYTSKSGMTFLDMGGSGDSSAFSAVIFASDSSNFSNVAGYNGKTIDVTGTVQMYQGKAEIILKSPSQISAK